MNNQQAMQLEEILLKALKDLGINDDFVISVEKDCGRHIIEFGDYDYVSDSDVKELEDKIDDLEDEISDLEREKDELEEKIEELEETIERLKIEAESD